MRREAHLPGADRRIIITWALLAINLVVWVAMEMAGGSTNQDVLLAFGAMFGPFIASGEYWRLFTAMFLHVGIMHLLFNGFGLLIFGRLVERIYGYSRFITIYLLAGLSGSVASYTFNRIAIGAGASGAIFGILGALAAFFLARRDTLGEMGRQNLIGISIIAAINLVFGLITPGIDNWAHMGGLAGGFVLGLAFAPRYQPSFLTDSFGFSYRIVDVSSAVRRWWIVPLVLAVLAAGVWLATSTAPDVAQAQTYVIQAERLLEQRDYERALQEAEKAIELDPTSGPALFTRGKIYIALGMDGLARSDLSASLRLGLDADSRQEAIRLMLEIQERRRF